MNKKMPTFIGFLLVAVFIIGVMPVRAATVNQDITLKTTSGSNITLLAGGVFDSFTVGANSFTFTLSGTQSVRLRDSDAQTLETNIDGLKGSCDGANSEITLSASKGTSIELTIKAFACSGGGGGGGGGGSSAAGGSTTSSTATQTTTTTATAPAAQTTTTATVAPAQTPSPNLEGAPPPPSTLIGLAPTPTAAFVDSVIIPTSGILQLNRRLSVGSSGEDVRALQGALASMPDVYPEGKVTGYFGSLTKAAVAKFQMKYGIVSSSSDAGYGSVGPMTRAKLMEVFGSGMVATTPAPSVSAVKVVLARELSFGASGDDVTQLQAYLAADPAIYPEGKITGYYGSLTVAAVRRFQAKYGISQVGRVGPQTMAKLNEVMGQGANAPLAPVSTGSSPSDDQARAALQSQIQDMQALVNSLTQQLQAAQ